MKCPKAVLFDLDETLAPSFQPPSPEMAARLSRLIVSLPVAIISGAGFDRIMRDLIPKLQTDFSNLSLFPNSSAQCFLYQNGAWNETYSHLLSSEERAHINAILTEALETLPELTSAPRFGERIIDREAQVAFTAVGLDAPAEAKAAWDPTIEKRLTIARYLRDKLPEFNILIGGSSTIDITRKDINKSVGVLWYAEYLKLQPEDMLYVGDALFPGGNDEVVIPTGVQTHGVKNPMETEVVVDHLLVACSA